MMDNGPVVTQFADAPLLVLFLIAGGLILYGLTQPRFRVAALSVLGIGFFGLIASTWLYHSRSSTQVVAVHNGSVTFRQNFTPWISPMEVGVLLLVAVIGVLIYGATQPKYRVASLTTLGIGSLLVILGGATFVAVPVAHVEVVGTQYGQHTDGRLQMVREQEWENRTTLTAAADDAADTPATNRSSADSLPPISNRIELFEGTRRSGTSLETLPDWITAPVESDPTRMLADSGPRASFEECESELMNITAAELASRLALRHPQAAGWRPKEESIRSSGAITKRVRETQTVRIDVADAVIREPLYREYWMIASDDDVLDRLLAEWRPSATQHRAGLLAKGLGLATLLFGGIAFGIRMSGGRPQPMPA